MNADPRPTILTREDVTEEVLEHVFAITEGYYLDQPIDRFDFIDRLESHTEAEWGDQIDSPAIEYALRKARAHRREVNG